MLIRSCLPIAGFRTPVVAMLACCTIIASAQLVSAQQRVNFTVRSSTTGEFLLAGGTEQTTCLTGDLFGDGRDEILVADRSMAPSLLLFHYETGTDSWTRYIINSTQLDIEAGGALHDVDGDGDLDVVCAGDFNSQQVWWWENPAPTFAPTTPWTRRLIKDGGGNQHHDLAFGDFDGDGSLEMAIWLRNFTTDRRLRVYDVPADPTLTAPWPTFVELAFPHNPANFSEGLIAADVDRDGIMDFLAGGRWYRYVAGSYTSTAIDPGYSGCRIAAADLVPGGYLEIVLGSGDAVNPLNIYQWTGTSWASRTLIGLVTHGHSLELGDVDLDGHLDIFTAEMGNPGAGAAAQAWIGWGNSRGEFTFEEISVGIANHMSRLADVDGNGRLDVVMKPFNQAAPRLDVYLNQPAPLSLDLWQQHVVDDNVPWRIVLSSSADFDGDGDRDIAAGGFWYPNPGTAAGPWVRTPIDPGQLLNNLVVVGDLDHDGDPDILGTRGKVLVPLDPADNGDRFYFARNNGTGTFTVTSAGISGAGSGNFFQGATGGQLHPGQGVRVLVNWQNGETGATPVQVGTPPAGGPAAGAWTWGALHPFSEGEDLTLGDIDGDGDLDVYQGRSWLRNQGVGQPWINSITSPSLATTFGTPDRNWLADMDQDGDLDAVVGFGHAPLATSEVVWFEQPADPTQLWPIHTIFVTPGAGHSLFVGDLDRDGDPDVVHGEHTGPHRLFVHENVGGNGLTWTPHLIHAGDPNFDHHDGFEVVDIDADGDLDVIAIAWFNFRVWLFENCAVSAGSCTIPNQFIRGDCNADTYLDISDPIFLIAYLFAAGTTPLCLDACDANDMAGVDLADASALLMAVFTGAPPPMPPWPACGVDPTADADVCVTWPSCP